MDGKTARSNFFIIGHLLILFLISAILTTNSQLLSNPWVAFAYYLLLVILPVLVFIRIFEHGRPWIELGFTSRPLKGIAIGLIIGGVIGGIFFLLGHFVFKKSGASTTWLAVLGTGFAGCAEEILFRGFILPRMMNQMAFVKANILVSLLFAALHAAALMVSGTAILPQMVLLVIVSLWLGYIFKKTRSIWAVMLTHALYNLSVLLFL